jgi:RimJ/RimL family protein N-acetyltransferase
MTTAETDRLLIRPPVEADRPRFIELFSDDDFMVFSGRVHDAKSANARFDRMLTVADAADRGEMLCIIAANNTPSHRVADKVGFRWWQRVDWSDGVPTDLLVRPIGTGGQPLRAPNLTC